MITSVPLNLSPLSLFGCCYGQKGLFFLDSSLANARGRYSYIGFNPKDTVAGHDLGVLRRRLGKLKPQRTKGIFTGGAVGYLTYEGTHYFGIYDQVLIFDHTRKQWLMSAPQQRNVTATLEMIKSAKPSVPIIHPVTRKIQLKSNFNKTAFVRAVQAALKHIHDGDIYQINLSRRIHWSAPHGQTLASPLAIYSALRQCSPTPFAAYFDDGHQVTLSSSPERFVKLTGRTALVSPMKGTRPRGTNPREDQRNKQELRASPKEKAELLMVTDLERNDLGRVCDYGTVKVKHMRTIESYQQVFQATSTVEGRLRKDCDGIDLIQAAFPSGSVTGCPKIEAMKIIRRLESVPRGLYTGALGYVGFDGDMDFSVLIRSLFLTKNNISFHVGSGIVADSSPAAEYEETCLKAKAMEQALRMVFEHV